MHFRVALLGVGALASPSGIPFCYDRSCVFALSSVYDVSVSLAKFLGRVCILVAVLYWDLCVSAGVPYHPEFARRLPRSICRPSCVFRFYYLGGCSYLCL